MLRKTRKKKSSAVPLFRSGRRSPIFAGLTNKGKVGVQRGRETAGVPSFLPLRRAPQRPRRPQTANPPAEVQRKSCRPSGATPLTQFACPSQPALKNSPPVRGEPPTPFACPRGSVPENKGYPLTNPNLTAIILKLIHKCHEKEEYFSFARLERVRPVQAPRRGRRRSLWSRTAEFSLSCSV